MKLVIRLANPKNEKERMLRLEVPVPNELHNPSEAYVVIDEKEYTIEIHY